MTDQEIYNLLIKIDRGYVPTLQQKQELSSVNEIYWGSINKLPKCIGLLSALSYLDLSGTQVSDIRALSNLTSLTDIADKAFFVDDESERYPCAFQPDIADRS